MSYEILKPQQSGELLPPRFKSSNVDRFVPILKDVLLEKREIRFKNHSIGLNEYTAISRVRDAALAVIRGKQFYPDVDADKLRDIWPLYRVKYDHIAQEVVVYKYRERTTAVPDNVFDPTIRTEEVNFERTLKAYAYLYGSYHMRGIVTILGVLDDNLKDEVTKSYNVFFRQIGPTEHIMT